MPKGLTITLLYVVALVELACAFGATWCLLPGLYNTSQYRVDVASWTPLYYMAAFAIPAILLPAGFYLLRRQGFGDPAALAAAWVPLLANAFTVACVAAGARLYFLAPLLLAVSVAAAFALTVRSALKPSLGGAAEMPAHSYRLPALAICALAVLTAVCLYSLQTALLAKLTFGWTDAGLYYMRVKNTALGAGFLQETMARPPFYDHFDPGLAALVPFYWAFPTFKLIMWAQALFLATVAPAVFVYARGKGLGARAALLISLAVLLHPSISQMAASFSYGFHPVTLALPAVVLSIHFWEKRRWLPFALCAVFAASMEETLFPLYAGIGLVELVAPRGRRVAGASLFAASVAAFAVVTQVVMPAFAGDAGYFQLAKYSHLGSSAGQIILSPITKPGVFWGLIFSARSATFVALLLGATAFLPLLAPRQLLYPAVVLVFVLLLGNPDVKSISFWYQGLIVAAWFPAAAAGALRLGQWWSGGARERIVAAAWAAAVAAFAASFFYGMLPWSHMTVPSQMSRSPEFMRDAEAMTAFARTVPKDARVLATMRAATLFADAGSASPLQDWGGGTDYDVVVLQKDDTWGQSPRQIEDAFKAFSGDASFRLTGNDRFAVFVRN